MNRHEFIKQLRIELSKLPPEEIEEATEYFEEFFEEATAGLDGDALTAEEEHMAAEFGDPKKIAAQIKADYAARLLDEADMVTEKKPGTGKVLTAVWWIIIGICSAPVFIPLAICAVLLLILIYAAIAGGIIASIAGVVLGLTHLSASVAAGIMGIGLSLMLLTVSVFAAYVAYIATRAVVKAAARSIMTANAERRAKKSGRNPNEDDWVSVVAE